MSAASIILRGSSLSLLALLAFACDDDGKPGGDTGSTGTTGSGSAGPPVSVLRESGFSSGGPIVSSLPPISSDRPYEEEDLGSLEDGGVPRAVRASRAFAASGASLASAVTDGFTVDDASTKSERDESTAQGEDGGDVSVDGSDSSKSN